MVTSEQARLVFERYVERCRVCEAFLPTHVAAVVRVAQFMAVADGIDPDEASAAAWLHDIGYSTGIHNGHAEASLRICEEENLRLSPAQVDAILNHGTNAHPTTELGKLMQKADKLSMIDFDLFKMFYPNALHVFKKQWLPAIAAIIPDEGEEGK